MHARARACLRLLAARPLAAVAVELHGAQLERAALGSQRHTAIEQLVAIGPTIVARTRARGGGEVGLRLDGERAAAEL
jgi:hypothetical protein